MIKKFRFKLVGIFIKLKIYLFRPFSIGVRAIILDKNDKVLLVKHSYSDFWYLPGGGVDKKEHLTTALIRELKEELGLIVKQPINLLGTYSNFYEYKSDYISIFIVKNYDMNFKSNLEIEKFKFFDSNKLPENISLGSRKRIEEYLGVKEIDYKW